MAHFELKPADFTPAAASLWGDMLDLDRPATLQEALDSIERGPPTFHVGDYFRGDGTYKGPCALGVSIKDVEAARAEFVGD